MIKAMMFVDGTWLYKNIYRLGLKAGAQDFHLDYGKLPEALASALSEQLHGTPVDLVRKFFFASHPENYALQDDDIVQRQHDFYTILKAEYHYETVLFPIDFRGHRIRRADRDAADDHFEPREKCVDIALGSTMLFNAAVPHAYDIAICILGDRDYIPVLQHVRMLGKRVILASVHDTCAREYADTHDRTHVKDFPLLWLDDMLDKIALKAERQQLDCQSPLHEGERLVWTYYRTSLGRPFYCDACREKFAEEKSQLQREFIRPGGNGESPAPSHGDAGDEVYAEHQPITGTIKSVKRDRGFGFIGCLDDDFDYFFHLSDLQNRSWDDVREGQRVSFIVKKPAFHGEAGAAGYVTISDDYGDEGGY